LPKFRDPVDPIYPNFIAIHQKLRSQSPFEVGMELYGHPVDVRGSGGQSLSDGDWFLVAQCRARKCEMREIFLESNDI